MPVLPAQPPARGKRVVVITYLHQGKKVKQLRLHPFDHITIGPSTAFPFSHPSIRTPFRLFEVCGNDFSLMYVLQDTRGYIKGHDGVKLRIWSIRHRSYLNGTFGIPLRGVVAGVVVFGDHQFNFTFSTGDEEPFVQGERRSLPFRTTEPDLAVVRRVIHVQMRERKKGGQLVHEQRFPEGTPAFIGPHTSFVVPYPYLTRRISLVETDHRGNTYVKCVDDPVWSAAALPAPDEPAVDIRALPNDMFNNVIDCVKRLRLEPWMQVFVGVGPVLFICRFEQASPKR